jgi:hypothetical protein
MTDDNNVTFAFFALHICPGDLHPTAFQRTRRRAKNDRLHQGRSRQSWMTIRSATPEAFTVRKQHTEWVRSCAVLADTTIVLQLESPKSEKSLSSVMGIS